MPSDFHHRTLIVGFGCVLAAPALGQGVPPDYGFQWATIGAPGNRPTAPYEVPADPGLRIGAVDHPYRITTSKVTNPQYLEFVRAYAPFWSGGPPDWHLTGYWIRSDRNPDGSVHYEVDASYEGYAARIRWEMAARFCNWLSNGKVNEAWAFESGAYDTSTFTHDESGFHYQTEHSPGARFWIPSRDEWAKAAYYDPNRYGPGQEGYWAYPNGTDRPLRMGLPEDGGETIGDLLWRWEPRDLGAWDLGQYPDVRSPWGLTDISATVPDYTEFVTNVAAGTVAAGGSLAGMPTYAALDSIMMLGNGSLWANDLGALRIASSVPGPGGAVVLGLTLSTLKRKRT
jgi:hypothetical protein